MLGVNRNDQITSGVGSFEATDTARRVSNLIRYGVVKEADYERALIRVELQDGELLTDWIPWFTPRAGGDVVWDPPTIGEVVMLVSPSGELANGVAMPGIFSDGNANGDRDGLHRRTYADGTVIEYDQDSKRLLIDALGANAQVILQASQIHLNPEGSIGGGGGGGGGDPPGIPGGGSNSLLGLADIEASDRIDGSILYFDATKQKAVFDSFETKIRLTDGGNF